MLHHHYRIPIFLSIITNARSNLPLYTWTLTHSYLASRGCDMILDFEVSIKVSILSTVIGPRLGTDPWTGRTWIVARATAHQGTHMLVCTIVTRTYIGQVSRVGRKERQRRLLSRRERNRSRIAELRRPTPCAFRRAPYCIRLKAEVATFCKLRRSPIAIYLGTCGYLCVCS